VFVGPVADPSGHADELRGFLRALEARGHEQILQQAGTSMLAQANLSPQSVLTLLA
jgi:hypothetical protein